MVMAGSKCKRWDRRNKWKRTRSSEEGPAGAGTQTSEVTGWLLLLSLRRAHEAGTNVKTMVKNHC